MAIKKLQNNFTTPEQSKRLLELGVPADSADLYFPSFENGDKSQPHLLYDLSYSKRVPIGYEKLYLPCWSVGRLMEIYDTCVENTESWPTVKQGISYVINTIVAIDYAVREGRIDFSKLEG